MGKRFYSHKAAKTLSFILIFLCVFVSLWQDSFADKIKLKERDGGNEVEILEESTNDFTIRIPKEEIESVTRARPTEAGLWKQKRVLWEDAGDYLIISIPKERVSTTGDTKTLEGALSDSGVKKTESTRGARVTGRVISGGKSLPRCLVRIVMVSGKKQGETYFTTITDEDGKYEFNNIPAGDYDVYWKTAEGESWIRKLSEKPNISIGKEETVEYPEIIAR